MPVTKREPRINAIATAVPASECNGRYSDWARRQLGEREAGLLDRMLQRSGIGNRYTVLSEDDTHEAAGSFYARPDPPSTADRMAVYADKAPELAIEAITSGQERITDEAVERWRPFLDAEAAFA